ncbi:c-type cytochrome domain-containing protein [Catenovulum adriaticum]|uniref:Cytochrome c domain-containing protein n=1 Tax=Catenovulum adriaticum TaxID=2984846 RepID=A0ABY7ARA0_9ALTE|nr:c-type cytochrome domain-containing protein [Catenovulum sp. TS8]WAJ72063.1 hypothetical protein OLW01_17430 [Catenovulum sp. TS8]
MDLITFFGRFHVLVLHLPIGILLMAAVIEMSCVAFNKPRTKTLNTIWLWGLISACGAALLGYMLSLSGGYSEEAVFTHKAWAFAAIFCALICWIFFSKQAIQTGPKKTGLSALIYSLCSVQLFLLFSTGHYGANMTHGSTYLFEYAPNPVRTLAGMEPHAKPRPKVTQLEQADAYLDIVKPILEQRCTGCHNPEKSKGKLNLTTPENIFKGGQSGPAVIASDLHQSELYKRITLDSHAKKFMPAGGKPPLTDNQVATLAWWIESGAPVQTTLADLTLSKKARSILSVSLGLEQAKGGWPLPKIEMIPNAVAEQLTQQGFMIKQIAKDINYLDIDYSVSRQPLTNEALNGLLSIKEHVVWLNLANSQVSNEQLKVLAQFPNLLKLHLEKNPISDQGIEHLTTLNQLQYLNLYRTNITNTSLNTLASLPNLTRLYTGETKVTSNTNASLAPSVSTSEKQNNKG